MELLLELYGSHTLCFFPGTCWGPSGSWGGWGRGRGGGRRRRGGGGRGRRGVIVSKKKTMFTILCTVSWRVSDVRDLSCHFNSLSPALPPCLKAVIGGQPSDRNIHKTTWCISSFKSDLCFWKHSFWTIWKPNVNKRF